MPVSHTLKTGDLPANNAIRLRYEIQPPAPGGFVRENPEKKLPATDPAIEQVKTRISLHQDGIPALGNRTQKTPQTFDLQGFKMEPANGLEPLTC